MIRKNRLVGLIVGVLSAITVFSGCFQTTQPDGFKLSYFDGMDIEKYDTDLLWRNTSEVANDGSGDGDVFYVSEEEDSVYGGYFYMYSTKNGGVPSAADGSTPVDGKPAAYYPYVLTSRSKDLVDWEMCGAVDNCYSLKLSIDTWVLSHMYAPEVIRNPQDGKYYMYYSAASKQNTDGLREQGAKYSASSTISDRFYIGVAVSESPCGPFLPCTSENMYGSETAKNLNGYVLSEINPTIMVDEECDALLYSDEFRNSDDFDSLDEDFSVIDVSPFIDDDGTLYLYFVHHMSSRNPGGHCVWGVKMQDMVTPDYTTISCLFRGSYTSRYTDTTMLGNKDASLGKKFVRTEYLGATENDPQYPRHLETSWASYTTYADGTESLDAQSEATLVEAPNLLVTKDKDGKKVYVLSYAPLGVDRVEGDYDCKAAYSYNPLSGYIKPNPEDGAYILAVDRTANNFMSNLGHVSFVTAGNEVWIAHWQRQTPFGGLDQGRLYALSACSLQYMENTGIYMPVANGPTTSLQVKPSVATGYENIAKDATITVQNGNSNTVKYLNDGMWVTYNTNADKEFESDKNGMVEIKISFDTPRIVRGLMIYNSYTSSNAFKNISLVQFDLAETPSWRKGGTETACFIENLPYNAEAYLTSTDNYQPGSAAIATFNEMKVNSITIRIEKSDLFDSKAKLRISEIAVIGK